jgi:hypothetical protein
MGEYYGVVRVSRREFQCMLLGRSTLERWFEAYYLQRTRFENIAEDAMSAVLDRGPECRDQRTGFALGLALVVKEGPMNKLAPAFICIAILLTGCGSPLRADANAGPNPGGGFYGGPNINVGRINP